MTAYYNDTDPYCVQWLRNLITDRRIARGDVTETPIQQLDPRQLADYTQVHLFAGIGVWSLALRYGGWDDDWPVWTCSCPCQPFSNAGKLKGTADERHLWPYAFRLIQKRRPTTIVGEQVASKAGLAWFDNVQADLESEGYACAVADLCAAGFGAPHIRQRLFWVADSMYKRPQMRSGHKLCTTRRRKEGRETEQSGSSSSSCGLEYAEGERHRQNDLEPLAGGRQCTVRPAGIPPPSGLGVTDSPGWEQRGLTGPPMGYGNSIIAASSLSNNYWSNATWIVCTDGKARPIEPGAFPLAHGVANRVAKLRALGNSLCLQQAAFFVACVKEILFE